MDTPTNETTNLTDLAKRLTSPEGYRKLLARMEENLAKVRREANTLVGEITDRTKRLDRLAGSVQTMEAVIETIRAFAKATGWDQILTQPEVAPVAPAKVEEVPTAVSPETQARIDKGLCLFVSRLIVDGRPVKKACERKLRTKPEKECGYCSVHKAVIEGRKVESEER